MYYSGMALLLGGGALVYWSSQVYETLPNCQRLALMFPVTASAPLIHIDAFRNWASISTAERISAVGTLVLPTIVLVGAALWWLAAPGART